MTPLADAAARATAVTDVERSLLVEASAGTGKTKTLIDRILQLVLDAGEPLSSIAAMTFTEKAAGEMKERLRKRIDEEAQDARDPVRRDRAERARRDLDSAEVSTIHSFCSRLLRERPVESRVDPEFVTPEDGVARELFEEVFSAWIDEEARANGPVTEALRLGLGPGALGELATTLHEERTLVLSCRIPDDPVPYVQVEIESLVRDGDRLVEEVPSDFRDDPKVLLLRSALDEVRSLLSLGLEELAAFRPVTTIDFRPGKKAFFTGDFKTAANAFRDEWKALSARLAFLPAERLLAAVAVSVRDGFLPRLAAEKERRGLLDFDDLLLAARKLLRDSRAAREHFQERFPHLVVDEFQDTDPVQAEIVLRLAAPPGEQDPEKWDDLEPAPGALFLVGDPKQSIYRFRRADVETYRRVADGLGASARLSLVTNFRSAPRILDFVNGIFDTVFEGAQDEPWEVANAPLVPRPEPVDDARPGQVLYLATPELPAKSDEEAPGAAGNDGDEDDSADAKATIQEARAVANLLLSRFSAGGYRGAAVLLGSNDAIDLFQDVFRDAGIPAVLDGGVSFYRREETAAVVAALRAVDDPSDSVATVAALKSFLFGLTDVELLDASEAGTRFDEPATAPAEGPVAAALACLGSLRARRLHRPLAETLLDLLTTRRVLAAVENGAVVNGLQASANLDRLLVLARALDAEGLPFREAVARLGLRLEEKVPEPRAFEEDDDAVRLLTLHKAKGLEFDTVVVAGLGFRDREKVASRRSLFYDRAGGTLALRLPVAGLVVGTPGLRFVAAADELRLRAEEKRLLYVALTRAKKNLVLSWFRRRRTLKSGDVSDPIGKSLLRPIAFAEGLPARLAPLVEVVSPDVSIPPAPAVTAPLDAAVDLSAVMAAAEARLGRARATASRPLRRSGEKDGLWRPGASPGPASPEDLPSIERSEEVQARAVRLGSAVHEAMELLLDPERVPPSSAEDAVAATLPALDPAGVAEAVSLVERLLAHPVVARARASRRRFVELPVLFRDDALEGSPLVEGKIDLLFEEDDGWVVVDWKTDRVSTAAARAEREALYTPQLASYARALTAVLGPGTIVKEMVLAFARG
ncbi:MAG: UvrD-helicase domain-containing protein [Holophagales bacterium]|nr:UvrD-helicase domain-containing protein [Holophagales bacterium]